MKQHYDEVPSHGREKGRWGGSRRPPLPASQSGSACPLHKPWSIFWLTLCSHVIVVPFSFLLSPSAPACALFASSSYLYLLPAEGTPLHSKPPQPF